MMTVHELYHSRLLRKGRMVTVYSVKDNSVFAKGCIDGFGGLVTTYLKILDKEKRMITPVPIKDKFYIVFDSMAEYMGKKFTGFDTFITY